MKALKSKGIELKFNEAEYKPWRDGDIKHSLGSIDLATKDLGFIPSVDLSEGIVNILSQKYGF